ncbi:MAG TPA: amylo-alpha-1,6-glucosidase [Chloroflexota bacterium]
MTERALHDIEELDPQQILNRLQAVVDRQTVDTEIGRIVMPGPTYLGIWARDTGIVTLGLNRLGDLDLARELLHRYWSYQIGPDSDPTSFVFRNKGYSDWTEAYAFHPSHEQLQAEIGAFPTTVYIQTPNFPPGTCEIYASRADPDSVGWLIIALHDYYVRSGDLDLLRELAPAVVRAVSYLERRDEDGDHLLEQGPNEDWADILLRRGKVSYTQAIWFRCLEAAAGIFDAVREPGRAARYRWQREAVHRAINRVLFTPHGFYANYVTDQGVSLRRSLDTALLVAFGACDVNQGRRVLERLDTLDGPFGLSVVEPGYAPDAIGPSHYPPGQYQNEGIWPWISSYLALAWARVGEDGRAQEIIHALSRAQQDTTYEWIDSLTGECYHPEFATGAGAMAWVITESGLTG